VLIGIVVGGALGNVVDRLSRARDGFMSGAVVDFIDLQWWPIFNVADAAVVVGGILLAVTMVMEPDGVTGPG
jgi:signal peptidase II